MKVVAFYPVIIGMFILGGVTNAGAERLFAGGGGGGNKPRVRLGENRSSANSRDGTPEDYRKALDQVMPAIRKSPQSISLSQRIEKMFHTIRLLDGLSHNFKVEMYPTGDVIGTWNSSVVKLRKREDLKIGPISSVVVNPKQESLSVRNGNYPLSLFGSPAAPKHFTLQITHGGDIAVGGVINPSKIMFTQTERLLNNGVFAANPEIKYVQRVLKMTEAFGYDFSGSGELLVTNAPDLSMSEKNGKGVVDSGHQKIAERYSYGIDGDGSIDDITFSLEKNGHTTKEGPIEISKTPLYIGQMQFWTIPPIPITPLTHSNVTNVFDSIPGLTL